MEDVMHQCEGADENTWVLFDIDMVLVQPSDPVFQMPAINQYSHVAKKVYLSVSEPDRDCFLTLVGLSSSPVLIDGSAPNLLQKLHEAHVPTMALTANVTGRLGAIDSLEKLKIAQLKNLGITFNEGAPYKKDLIFTDLPSYRGYCSLYTEGFLFTNGTRCNKGEVLATFLKYCKISPKKIIFIDDREENLQSVEQSLADNYPAIAFTGVHYLEASLPKAAMILESEFESKWQELAQKTQELRADEIARRPSCVKCQKR